MLKNTVFKGVSNQILTLSLDAQYASMLTEVSQKNIQTILKENFAITKIDINLGALTEQTLAQKETQAQNEKNDATQQAFLADKGVQKLQQTFNMKVDINSIKATKEVTNV